MTKQNKLSMLYEAMKQVGGYNELQQLELIDEEANVLYFQTDELNIRNPKLAPMHIDGDPVETAEKIQAFVRRVESAVLLAVREIRADRERPVVVHHILDHLR